MATKRIDFVKRGTNKYPKVIVDGIEHVFPNDMPHQHFQLGSWTLTVTKRYIKIFCSSKAKEKRRNFKIELRSGSLFLYNSTTNWYWYFRSAEVQEILDKLNIDKMVTLDRPAFTCSCIYSKATEVIGIPVTLQQINQIRYYSPGASVDKEVIGEYEEGLYRVDLTFNFKNYLIIQESAHHRTLYMFNCKLKDNQLSDGYPLLPVWMEEKEEEEMKHE